MTLDTKKDREIAQAATPGPWATHPMGDPNTNQNRNPTSVWAKRYPKSCDEPLFITDPIRYGQDADAVHIARFNPARALEYIDTVEKQARAIDALMEGAKNTIARADDYGDSYCSAPIRRALSEAREILGGQAVNEKGDGG